MIGKDRDQLVEELVAAGRLGIAGGDEARLDAYFTDDFVFHGPGGDARLPDLKAFWDSMRTAFTGFTVERGHIVVEGNFVASQTFMGGTFERTLTQSPVGEIQPNGATLDLHLLNIFRFTDDGRLAEEWCQYDNLELLAQLGAQGSAAP